MNTRKVFFLILALIFTSALSANTESTKRIIPSTNSQNANDVTKSNVSTPIVSSEPDSKAKNGIEQESLDIMKYTLYVYISMLLVSAIQVYFFVRQLKLMRLATRDSERASQAAELATTIAKDAYIASVRPWVSVEAKLSADLKRENNGIMFYFDFQLRNHGKSPALSTEIHAVMVTSRNDLEQFSTARENVNILGRSKDNYAPFGINLFPGVENSIGYGFILKQSDIDLELAKREYPSDSLPPISIVGSVFYKSALDNKILQTDFHYSILSKTFSNSPISGIDIPDFENHFPFTNLTLNNAIHNIGSIK